MTNISSKAVFLLLNLLEGKSLRYTHAALTDFHGPSGDELIRAGLVAPVGFERATVAEDDDDRLVELDVDINSGALGYQSPTQGWVSTDQSSSALYAPRLDKIFNLLLGRKLRAAPSHPRGFDGSGHVWELGSARVFDNRLTSVWFCRRLSNRDVVDALTSENAARPSSSLRLLLTSTPRQRVSPLVISNATVVPISDVLSTQDPSKVDFAILKARMTGRPGKAISEVFQLSDDGRTLFIDGVPRVRFRGVKQLTAIKMLIEAHRRGERVNAADLLYDADSGCREFSQAFRAQWPILKHYLQNENGLWGFDL